LIATKSVDNAHDSRLINRIWMNIVLFGGYLSANPSVSSQHEITDVVRRSPHPASYDKDGMHEQTPSRNLALTARSSYYLVITRLSPWSQSSAKRLFDCVCVLLALPLLFPLLLATALAVRLTSPGPILFLQKRMGRYGRTFTIFKFRSLIHSTEAVHHAVTTADNQRFTPVGPFLRRWKLDELPQMLNVLIGDMSLVGPRPKMLEHLIADIPCRPGITGAATIAFAREEAILERVPKHHLDAYYHSIVLPAKRKLDADYMARATLLSDLKLIFDSALRRWNTSYVESLLNTDAFEEEDGILLSSSAVCQ
jgi:lipopolysaccharide/colanic/teichoic acid biosynthesis glycosyltransferase